MARGRPRPRVYLPETDRLLAVLYAEVKAGRVVRGSAEFYRRRSSAMRLTPGLSDPIARRTREAFDGSDAPREGTPLEVAARALVALRRCTFTEAVCIALGWRDIATV